MPEDVVIERTVMKESLGTRSSGGAKQEKGETSVGRKWPRTGGHITYRG